MSKNSGRGQFVRLSETERPEITIHVDGAPVTALAGDTLLTALLLAGRQVRDFEFGNGARAGDRRLLHLLAHCAVPAQKRRCSPNAR